jgi:hypothetical protein
MIRSLELPGVVVPGTSNLPPESYHVPITGVTINRKTGLVNPDRR